MATTTNYSWTTPDDTALVKDGASAIRSLGTSIDTTTKNLNPSTTLGDIEYRSSTANTNTRLGIGSTGNVLTVAGGVPTWAAPTAPASGLTLITPTSITNSGGTATLSGAVTTASGVTSVSFNGVFSSTYANYIVAYNELIGSGATTTKFRYRVSGTDNSASNYYWADNQCSYAGIADTASNSASTEFWINLNTGSTVKQGGFIQLFSPNVATQKTFNTLYQNAAQKGSLGGYHSGTIQADGFTIFVSANAISGIFRVYGIQN